MVPPHPDVRPTPDRVRETLFNWLAPSIEGARCLDLFAGTGVLGLEAASRGAREVYLVEQEPVVVESLRSVCARLGASGVYVVHNEAIAWLATRPSAFDIVFLDPPYRYAMIGAVCRRLESGGWLAPGSLIYVERAREEAGADPLPDWTIVREATAGRVHYCLMRRD
jgi:16S rRNA (guanine966-N2)-methyltransferase